MKRAITKTYIARIVVESLFLALFALLILFGRAQLWLAVFGAGAVLSLVFSRFYCAWLCPMNTLFRPIDFLYKKLGIKRLKMPRLMSHPAIRVLFVSLFIVSMFLTKRLALSIPPLLIVTVLAVLVVLVFEEALWHNSFCPYGTILSFTARPAIKKYAVDEEKCVACGLCQKVCAVHAIDTLENGKRYIRKADCLVCGHCARVCPTKAIRYG